MRGEGDRDSDEEHSDAALAARARAGEASAFRRLIERHYDRVFRVALAVTGDPAEAEDLTQEIWSALPAKLASWRGEARLTTWLHRIALNAARDALRRRANAARALSGYADHEALQRGAAAEAERRLAWLAEALEELAPDLRETAALVLGEALSHGRAAEVLQVAESTVSWRMGEIRKRLRAKAQRESGGDSDGSEA